MVCRFLGTVSFSVVSGRSTCNRPDPQARPRPEPEAGPYPTGYDARTTAGARAANTLSATTPTSLLRLCKRSRPVLHGLRIGKDDSRTRTRARIRPPFFSAKYLV